VKPVKIQGHKRGQVPNIDRGFTRPYSRQTYEIDDITAILRRYNLL
jgi:hypothetical protein